MLAAGAVAQGLLGMHGIGIHVGVGMLQHRVSAGQHRRDDMRTLFL